MSPRIWSREDAKANCPPQISSYRYKNERSVAFKIRQNPFLAGALSRTPLRKLTTLPQTPSRLGREHPTRHRPTFTYLRRSPCVPPEVQLDLPPMRNKTQEVCLLSAVNDIDCCLSVCLSVSVSLCSDCVCLCVCVCVSVTVCRL